MRRSGKWAPPGMIDLRLKTTMPGGASTVGFVAFAAVKAAGYTGAAFYLSRAYGTVWSARRKIGIGLARTALGIAVGVTYGTAWSLLLTNPENPNETVMIALFYGLLLPVRLAEWWLLLWFFFDRRLAGKGRIWKYAALGTGLSYLLDLLAVVAALVVPGGMWIC